jgi:hypothetical protein
MTFDPDWRERLDHQTPTVVVNLKHDEYDVYIGRAGKGQDGYFGNPHTMGYVYCSHCKGHHDRDTSIAAFKKDFLSRVNNDREFLRRVLTLRGKRLGCFCKPLACHGDVIKEWLDEHPNLR